MNGVKLVPLQESVRSGWSASLGLAYEPSLRREPPCTILRRREQVGPLTVQKPFYPEGAVCHTYILHPPGGIVGGDSLALDLRVESGAHALVTTPAATKVYRSAGPASHVTQAFEVAAGGLLEWLPADTILFGGSRHRLRSRINLAPDAAFIGWEIVSLGRPASGDVYPLGDFSARLTVLKDGLPLLHEGQRWRDAEDARWQLAGHRVYGALYVYPGDADLLELARSALDDGPIAATLVDDLLVVRALGNDPVRMREHFNRVWSKCRPLAVGREACMPRIWAT